MKAETAEEVAAPAEKTMALARQITKDSWLVEGVTEEEYDRGLLESDIFERLLGRGYSEDKANALIDSLSFDEVQRQHREMYPAQYTNGNGK